MKKKALMFFIFFLFLTSGCSNNSSASVDEDIVASESIVSEVPTTELSTANEIPSTEFDSLVSASDDSSFTDLDELNSRAKELAEKSTEITSGEFYEDVIAIYPGTTITDSGDGSLTFNIEFPSIGDEDPQDYCNIFFYCVSKIIADTDFLYDYDEAFFILQNPDSYIGDVLLLKDSSGQWTTLSSVSDESYNPYFENAYYALFSEFDSELQFDNFLSDTAKKYGISD